MNRSTSLNSSPEQRTVPSHRITRTRSSPAGKSFPQRFPTRSSNPRETGYLECRTPSSRRRLSSLRPQRACHAYVPSTVPPWRRSRIPGGSSASAERAHDVDGGVLGLPDGDFPVARSCTWEQSPSSRVACPDKATVRLRCTRSSTSGSASPRFAHRTITKLPPSISRCQPSRTVYESPAPSSAKLNGQSQVFGS